MLGLMKLSPTYRLTSWTGEKPEDDPVERVIGHHGVECLHC